MEILNEMKHVSPAGLRNQQLINTHTGYVAVFSLLLELLFLLHKRRSVLMVYHSHRRQQSFGFINRQLRKMLRLLCDCSMKETGQSDRIQHGISTKRLIFINCELYKQSLINSYKRL